MELRDDGTVVGRTVLILETVGAAGCVSLAHLTARTGLAKATARRISERLVERGLLCRRDDGYALGARLTRLATAARPPVSAEMAAAPYLQELFARSGEVVFWLAECDDALVLQAVVCGRRRALDAGPGLPPVLTVDRVAAFTAAGRVLLADRADLTERVLASDPRRLTPYSTPSRSGLTRAIDRVRDTGVAVEVEEHTQGWACVAAGIRDRDGDLSGVLGVCGRAGAFRHDLLAPPRRRHGTSARGSTAHAVVTMSRPRPVDR